MSILQGPGPDERDQEMERLLRSQYLPPDSESYWSGLEARIMRHVVADGRREWWTWVSGWARVGAAAAAAAILISAIVTWQHRTTQQRIAVRELFDDSDVPVFTQRTTPVTQEREQTLRYLLSR